MNRFGPTLRAARAGDWSCGFLSAGFGLGCASEVSLYLKDQGSYSRLGAEIGLGLVRACDFVAVCYVPLYLSPRVQVPNTHILSVRVNVGGSLVL